jgi:hypothetical protein
VTKNQPSTKTSRKKLLATLWKSPTSGTPVQVQRSVEPHEVLGAVMVELGGTWVLLAGIRNGAYLNGYHALRLQDLVRVKAHATFVPLLQRYRPWPPATPIKLPRPVGDAVNHHRRCVFGWGRVRLPGGHPPGNATDRGTG